MLLGPFNWVATSSIWGSMTVLFAINAQAAPFNMRDVVQARLHHYDHSSRRCLAAAYDPTPVWNRRRLPRCL
jgi:hypothetical protein